jgi:hypothetical protein
MNQVFTKEFLKELVRKNWKIKFFVFLFLRPKRFLSDFVYSLIDYRRFKKSAINYISFFLKTKKVNSNGVKPGLLIVAGNVMNVQWCQVWSIFSGVYNNKGYNVFVLTSKGELIQNLYFSLFKMKKIYLENLNVESVVLNDLLINKINHLEDFEDIKQFEDDGAPIGKMALSTFSRIQATGIMNVKEPESLAQIRWWMIYLCKTMQVASKLYEENNISMLFFTELFMEYYGGFYYSALKESRNIIRFSGTVRDNAIVVTHQTHKNDRTHFSSISDESWIDITSRPFSKTVEEELNQNFINRYSDRWSLSKRNQPNTHIVPVDEAKRELGIYSNRRVAVIYSHILYDTLFFNGEYLFKNYADWLVQSIKAACKNPNVDWYIKIHPSNLWRGELEYYHGGIYEEVRLIREFVGDLPDNVKLIYPDTPYSPYTWLQIADYGITVTGTSGIELGALGKAVVTAGTGRYEDVGFTINSASQKEYLDVLENIQECPLPDSSQKMLGKRFAYATFCMKPFTLDFLKAVPRMGKSEIFGSDDLVYLADFGEKEITSYPDSMNRFIDWSFENDKVDFLNSWPTESEQKGIKASEGAGEIDNKNEINA